MENFIFCAVLSCLFATEYNIETKNRTRSTLHSSSNGNIVYVTDKKEMENYVKNVTIYIKNQLSFYYKNVMQIMVHF